MDMRQQLYMPIVTYCAVAYILFSMKPASMFDNAGNARPFGLNSDIGQTPLPWWLLSLMAALVVHHLRTQQRYVPLN